MLNMFLFNKFFEKSSIFWENLEKLFSRRIRPFFRERRRLAPKININFFIANVVLLAIFRNEITTILTPLTSGGGEWGGHVFHFGYMHGSL